MPEDYSNIYKIARRAAGYTQEAAAEQLNISIESVRAYETYQRTPPADVVERMVVCFGAPQLAYQHLHETNALISRVIPQLEPRSIPEVAIRIYNRMRSFSQGACLERLMAIAEPEFDAIVKILRSIIQSSLELEIFCSPDSAIKKERPEAATSRRSVQGLASENDCKTIVTQSAQNASPNLTGKEVPFP